jgi:hypothetical protein
MKNLIRVALILLAGSFLSGCVVHIPTVPVGQSTKHGVYLGSRSVGKRKDKDHFRVGANLGTFQKLRLRVVKAPVRIKRVTVHFGNGKARNLQVKPNFKANDWSRWIDLPGGKRRIERVVIVATTPKGARRLGRVMAYAQR